MAWQLTGSQPTLTHGPLHAAIDLSECAELEIFNASRFPITTFSFAVPEGITAESYLRGVDCVASFPDTPRKDHVTTAYWRSRGDWLSGPGLAVELILSVQTDLLGVNPHTSLLAHGHALSLEEVAGKNLFSLLPEKMQAVCESLASEPSGCFRAALNDDWTYLEFIHPLDRAAATTAIHPPGELESFSILRDLFTRSLEKGVILRSRLLAAVVPAADADAMLPALYRSFADAPPPLTT